MKDPEVDEEARNYAYTKDALICRFLSVVPG
jgi:hypothetical protein